MDLNADVGEGVGADADLLPFVTSVNVACGFHAGEPILMDRVVGEAVAAGVAVGVHPGYPDVRGFGRRALDLKPAEIEADVLYQIGALAAFARAHGTSLRHVKPHGALYHRAATDAEAAQAVARGCARAGVGVLVGPSGAEVMRRAAEANGLRFAAEAFADRRYAPDGGLLPRGSADALIVDPREAAEQAVRLAAESADTLCVHGDTPGAAILVQAVRSALEAAGIMVAPLAV
jgi:UPF0271 protein